MLKQQVLFINTILMTIDACCIIAAGYGAFFLKYYEAGGQWGMDTNMFAGSVILVMVVNNYTMGKFRLYSDRRPASYTSLVWSVLKALVLSFGALSIGILFFQEKTYSRLFFIMFALISLFLIVGFRILFQFYLDKIIHQNPYSRKILLIGSPDRRQYVNNLLTSQLSWGHQVIGHLDIAETGDPECGIISSCEELEKFIRENTVDEVVFALDKTQAGVSLSEYIDICRKTGLSCRILPAMWKPSHVNLSMETCQGVPFLTLQSTRFNANSLIYKRILDIVGGLTGTILFLIFYPLVAVAIKTDSPGPVIFRQKRVGKHGRIFELLKFRTMYQDAEDKLKELMGSNEMNGAMFKIKNDPRITGVGRWLRKTSLDELPQFVNVLKGEMSLVGTRPPTPYEVEKYSTDHLKRIAAKPGITGMWQVSGRNRITDFDTVVNLDWYYMENWRFSLDLKILVKTIWVVLRRKGAC